MLLYRNGESISLSGFIYLNDSGFENHECEKRSKFKVLNEYGNGDIHIICVVVQSTMQ